jgi:hypothetical protein
VYNSQSPRSRPIGVVQALRRDIRNFVPVFVVDPRKFPDPGCLTENSEVWLVAGGALPEGTIGSSVGRYGYI